MLWLHLPMGHADLLIERYLAYLEGPRRASPHTVTAYRSDLEDFSAFIERMDRAVAEVDHPLLRTYLANLETRGLRRTSITPPCVGDPALLPVP